MTEPRFWKLERLEKYVALCQKLEIPLSEEVKTAYRVATRLRLATERGNCAPRYARPRGNPLLSSRKSNIENS